MKTPSGTSGADWSLGTAMRKARGPLCLCFFFVSLASCEKSQTTSKSASPAASPEVSSQKFAGAPNSETGPAKFDVCGLIKAEEIQAIAGSSIEQQQSSARSNDGLRISQCVYLANQPSQSVSLVVTLADALTPRKQSPKDFWRERFGRYREEKNEKEEGKEEKEEGRPPRRIDNLGEEAFWTAGSLYVLQKDVFLRLSLGGSASEEAKLEQAKALAALALKRL